MEIVSEGVIVSEIAHVLQFYFRHIAEQKGLDFVIYKARDAPEVIRTDAMRLQQILRNLLWGLGLRKACRRQSLKRSSRQMVRSAVSTEAQG